MNQNRYQVARRLSWPRPSPHPNINGPLKKLTNIECFLPSSSSKSLISTAPRTTQTAFEIMKDEMISNVIPIPTTWGPSFSILNGPLLRNFAKPNVADETDIENDSQMNNLLSPNKSVSSYVTQFRGTASTEASQPISRNNKWSWITASMNTSEICVLNEQMYQQKIHRGLKLTHVGKGGIIFMLFFQALRSIFSEEGPPKNSQGSVLRIQLK